MTEKDKQLIAQAELLPKGDWDIAFTLAELADTEEARHTLKNIGRLLYHREEFFSGLL